MYREHTKEIHIGNRVIGGGNPILIQSMTNTKTEDADATIAQILELENAGCDIIRCAVPTMEAAGAPAHQGGIHIPLVADIHFDYRLALYAIKNGADKIRINPAISEAPGGLKPWSIWQRASDPHPRRCQFRFAGKEIIARYGRVNGRSLWKALLTKCGS